MVDQKVDIKLFCRHCKYAVLVKHLSNKLCFLVFLSDPTNQILLHLIFSCLSSPFLISLMWSAFTSKAKKMRELIKNMKPQAIIITTHHRALSLSSDDWTQADSLLIKCSLSTNGELQKASFDTCSWTKKPFISCIKEKQKSIKYCSKKSSLLHSTLVLNIVGKQLIKIP